MKPPIDGDIDDPLRKNKANLRAPTDVPQRVFFVVSLESVGRGATSTIYLPQSTRQALDAPRRPAPK